MIENPLSDIEWTTLWMSIRYACGRRSAFCKALPAYIVESYYSRLSEEQKASLSGDIKAEIRSCEIHSKYAPHLNWVKLMYALDKSCHFRVTLPDDTEITCFKVDTEIYPLREYISNPHCNLFIPVESIKTINDGQANDEPA